MPTPKKGMAINMDELQANKYFLFRNTGNLPNLGADAHYHSYFEIYCLTGGGGDSFVDNKLYNLQLGDVVVIPPGATHGTHYSTDRHDRILVNFTFHYIPKSLVEPLSGQAFLYRCEETREDVARIFEKIGKEYEAPDGFSEEAIRSRLAQLVIMIIRHVRGDEYLKLLALSRIFLDNIPHIEVSLLGMGLSLGELGLHAGADDINSIVIEENVLQNHGLTTIEAAEKFITDAGFTPYRRSLNFD